MAFTLTKVTGVNQGSSCVRVGHGSSYYNDDAVWSFTPTQTKAHRITQIKFTLKWNNGTGNSGWSGSYNYVFAVSSSSAAGRTAASGTHLGKATVALSGSSGTATVTVSDLDLTPGTTYYLRANMNGTTYSTMKSFLNTGNTCEVAGYYGRIVYNANGGTQGTSDYALPYTQKQASSTAARNLVNISTFALTKTGYHAKSGAEWNTKTDGSGTSFNHNTDYTDFWTYIPSAGTLTLYANWEKNTVKVLWNANGGTVSSSYGLNDYDWITDSAGSVIETVGTYGGTVTTPKVGAYGLNKTGYTLSGWQIQSNVASGSVKGTLASPGTAYNSNLFFKFSDSTVNVNSATGFQCYTYAQWTANKYTLTINPNGGSVAGSTANWVSDGSTNKPHLVYDTSNWYQFQKATRPGYTFTGYYTAATGGTKVYDASGVCVPGTTYWDSNNVYRYAGNLTVYAQWTPSTYTVSFDANGGTVSPTSKTVTYASTYGDLPTPTRDGHDFNGWFTESGTQITSSSTVSSTSNHTLYAQWTIRTYTISYDANGGTGAPGAQPKTYGVDLTLHSTEPTRAAASAGSYTITYNGNGGTSGKTSDSAARTTSYTFKNWNTNSDGTGTPYTAGAKYTANATVTLFAQWNSSTSTAAVTLPTASRTGYTFKGWNASSTATSGSTGSYTPTGNVTLYAIWEANTYTITFDANGGSGAPAAVPYTYAASGTITLTSTEPTKSDVSAGSYVVTLNANGGTCNTASLSASRTTKYTFSSWNTKADGSGTSYASGAAFSKAIASNTTLYAQYSSATVTSAVTLPDTTWFGHDFKGWNTSNSPHGTLYGSGNSFTPSNNITLYGIWKSIGILYMILKN